MSDRLAPGAGQRPQHSYKLYKRVGNTSNEARLQIEISSCVSVFQIRLALKDWEDVKKFEKDAVDAQHLDVVYVLQQLMFRKAFHFTAMPTLVSCSINAQILYSPKTLNIVCVCAGDSVYPLNKVSYDP